MPERTVHHLAKSDKIAPHFANSSPETAGICRAFAHILELILHLFPPSYTPSFTRKGQCTQAFSEIRVGCVGVFTKKNIVVAGHPPHCATYCHGCPRLPCRHYPTLRRKPRQIFRNPRHFPPIPPQNKFRWADLRGVTPQKRADSSQISYIFSCFRSIHTPQPRSRIPTAVVVQGDHRSAICVRWG